VVLAIEPRIYWEGREGCASRTTGSWQTPSRTSCARSRKRSCAR